MNKNSKNGKSKSAKAKDTKRKKITRLIPPEESLGVIVEEGSEVSEDQSVVSSSQAPGTDATFKVSLEGDREKPPMEKVEVAVEQNDELVVAEDELNLQPTDKGGSKESSYKEDTPSPTPSSSSTERMTDDDDYGEFLFVEDNISTTKQDAPEERVEDNAAPFDEECIAPQSGPTTTEGEASPKSSEEQASSLFESTTQSKSVPKSYEEHRPSLSETSSKGKPVPKSREEKYRAPQSSQGKTIPKGRKEKTATPSKSHQGTAVKARKENITVPSEPHQMASPMIRKEKIASPSESSQEAFPKTRKELDPPPAETSQKAAPKSHKESSTTLSESTQTAVLKLSQEKNASSSEPSQMAALTVSQQDNSSQSEPTPEAVLSSTAEDSIPSSCSVSTEEDEEFDDTALCSLSKPEESSVAVEKKDDDGLFNFDDEFDDDPTEADLEEEELTWRLDPALSLSDWTIVIKTKEEGIAQSYHVHKNILAVGPRRSEYFVKDFRAARQQGTCTTDIDLESVAAKVFPQMLDFMYSNEGTLEISTESACGLRHLAHFFRIRVLHKKVMEFIQKDLSLKTIPTYYKDLLALKDEKLFQTAARYCAQNVMVIDTASPLLTKFDPVFLKHIMSSPDIDSDEKRYHISLLLAEYCRINRDKLESKFFSMLTDEKVLPLIHFNAALPLLELEADIVVATATSVRSLMETSDLQKRCIKDLSTNWKGVCELDNEQVTRVCRKLPSGVVTDLLVKSLAQAKRSSEQTVESSGNAKKKNNIPQKVKKEYEAKMEKLKRDHQNELAKLKKEYEANLFKLRHMVLDKDKHIAKYWQEIKNFERVPNSHEDKLIPSGKQHTSTVMPEIGRSNVEGLLLVSKNGSAKYPLYYYKKEDKEGPPPDN